MHTILVSGASGVVGYGILKNLKQNGNRLIGTTIYSESPADCFADVVEIVPKAFDDGYIAELIRIIRKHHVDFMIPGIEDDMIVWNHNRDIICETGAVMLLNNSQLVSLCMDKWKFYEKLKEFGVRCRIESSVDADFSSFSTPFIIKPRRGYGSRGVMKIHNKDEFDAYCGRIGGEYMMQRLVGTDEEEYTVSVFFDRQSEIKAVIALRRKLSRSGYTELAEVVDYHTFIEVIKELSQNFYPVGPTNFQFRRDGQEWKLLEINPRISSSTSIRAGFGYNECQMAVDYFLDGFNITQPEIKKGKCIRYIEDFFCYDSTDF